MISTPNIQRKQKYEELIYQGAKLMSQKNFYQAREKLQEAIFYNDGDYMVYQHFATTLYYLNQHKQAVTYYQLANDLSKNEVNQLYCGLTFKQLGNYNQALKHIYLSIKINPTIDAYYSAGVILNIQNYFDKAVQHLVIARQLIFQYGIFDENAKFVFLELRKAKNNLNKKKREMLVQKLRQNPNDVNTLIQLSSVQIKLRQLQKGILNARRATELEPKNYKTYLVYGQALKMDRKYQDSCKILEKSLQLNQLNKDKKQRDVILSHLTLAYNLRKRYDIAEQYGSLSIQENHQNFWGHLNYGYALKYRENYKDAQMHFQKSIQINKFNYLPYRFLADLFRQQNKIKDAKKNQKIANLMGYRQIRNQVIQQQNHQNM